MSDTPRDDRADSTVPPMDKTDLKIDELILGDGEWSPEDIPSETSGRLQGPEKSPRTGLLLAVLGLFGLAIIGTVVYATAYRPLPDAVPDVWSEGPVDDLVSSSSGPSSPLPAPIVAEQPPPPAFDIVRVEQDGSFVIAGKAPAGALVQLMADDALIAELTANPRGEWVMAPDKLLAPGTYLLRLTARLADGTVLESAESVTVRVPERDETAIALAQPADGEGPTRILQGVGAAFEPGQLGLISLDYDDQGRLVVHGQARSGEVVRLYRDNTSLGEQVTGKNDRWTFVVRDNLDAGTYTLRVDRLSADGSVAGRVETLFEKPDMQTGINVETFVVRPGNNLWSMARRVYGDGWRYTVIYEANRQQIRDPDLIYPGQVFTLPRLETESNGP